MAQSNKALVYKHYTNHTPVPGDHIAVESLPFDLDATAPQGGITVKNLYLSFDPYQRNQIRLPTAGGSYSPPWVEGESPLVYALSRVLKTDNAGFQPGSLVLGFAAAAEYARVPSDVVEGTHSPSMTATLALPPLEGVDMPLYKLLNVLGVPGLSSYVSFLEYVPEPREGKTMVVSAASGAVGQIVGQLGKMHGMRIIGSTSSVEKLDFVIRELGFDGAWNTKEETTADALVRLAPGGVDVYYDNVGGEQLETILGRMNDFGSVVMSGMVSQYNLPDSEKYGVRTLLNIVFKRLSVNGFLCTDKHLTTKYMASFPTDMITWVAQGKIKTREDVVVGMDKAAETWLRLFSGDKLGKLILEVGEVSVDS
ncbi:putative zinc-type alcohol dehydrogenase-like protein PB24D3.08c [Xylariomycetidae sp. FL2044]|nr:putative zinc-type alcohol dehydrogenase-like protein PB24D3.08c [Xylariomycetidae sp. FL2044]